MHQGGTAYVMQWENEYLPDFINAPNIETILPAEPPKPAPWETILISGGRKDKISKGDIVGLCCKTGHLQASDIGHIELQADCAYVAIARNKIKALLPLINNRKLKKKKVRVRVI